MAASRPGPLNLSPTQVNSGPRRTGTWHARGRGDPPPMRRVRRNPAKMHFSSRQACAPMAFPTERGRPDPCHAISCSSVMHSYRTSQPEPQDPYTAAWNDYRRLRHRAWLAFLALLGGSILAIAATPVFGNAAATCTVLPLFLYWWSANVSWFKASCPRCGKPIHRRGLYQNFLSARCLNCGIAVGTPKSAAEPSSNVGDSTGSR